MTPPGRQAAGGVLSGAGALVVATGCGLGGTEAGLFNLSLSEDVSDKEEDRAQDAQRTC